jgi:nucleoside-diphosphate-sugar epimerase
LGKVKRVLVTGASGFIGRHTLPHLHAAGYEVHAVGSRDVDLLNERACRDLLARIRPTHLLHLAWYVPPGKYWTSLENVRWLQASLDLITAFAAEGGLRVVTAGTCAEYSWDGDGICHEDATPLTPASLYGASKDALRRMQESLARQLNLSAAWGRIFFPYGPGEPVERLIPSVIRSVIAGEAARCSHGRYVRDFMYVDDVARAFTVLLDSSYEGAVNIGTGVPVKISEMAQAAARAAGDLGLLQLGALPAREGEPEALLADTARLRDLGFTQRWNLEDAMTATVSWWRSGRYTETSTQTG